MTKFWISVFPSNVFRVKIVKKNRSKMNNTYRNTEKQYPRGGVFREYPRKKNAVSDIVGKVHMTSIFSKIFLKNEFFTKNGKFFFFIKIDSVR